MTQAERLPKGFLAAGVHAGIKNSKRDLGALVSQRPAVLAAVTTTNSARAHCVRRTERLLLDGGQVRGIIASSGNANALNGPDGEDADAEMAGALAAQLGVDPSEVLTASTGAIGVSFPVSKVESSMDELVRDLSRDATSFSEAILTTDRVTKTAAREVFLGGDRVQFHGVIKGSGMIAPSMATMLCFVTTDAAIDAALLRPMLRRAVGASFNQITVDEDMSTNDMVFVMANGAAENAPLDDEAQKTCYEALESLLVELAQTVARDGEGATRLLTVEVAEAASLEHARELSRAVAGSSLVKAGVFGSDPYVWGRMVSSMGARAAQVGAAFDISKISVSMQGVPVFAAGSPIESDSDLRHRMTEAEIVVRFELGEGTEAATAWGCDLSYEYVKINADYAAASAMPAPETLKSMAPTAKKTLLIEALRYIDQFRGQRAVIKLGGAAMVDPELEKQFAEDILLLESVGLRPIVVHGGGPEISRTLDRLGHSSEFIDGLRVTNAASMDVVEMVLSGKVNQRLVAAINADGIKGVGMSGKDGGLIRARRLDGHGDLGQVGDVVSVDTGLIGMLLEDGRVPVVSPVGLGEDGLSYNINADVVAAALAGALSAHKLIFMSDVPGFLEGGAVVSELDADSLKLRIDRGEVTGGMLPKLKAALDALAAGVDCVHLVDGRVSHNLIAELFTDRGVGTLIRAS